MVLVSRPDDLDSAIAEILGELGDVAGSGREQFVYVVSSDPYGDAYHEIGDAVLARFQDLRARFGWPLKYDEVYHVFDEAFQNAVEHGNRERPGSHVELEIIAGEEAGAITVRDYGGGFNHKRMLDNFFSGKVYCSGRGFGLSEFDQAELRVSYIGQGNILAIVTPGK